MEGKSAGGLRGTERYKIKVLLLISDTWQLSQSMSECVHVGEGEAAGMCEKCNMAGLFLEWYEGFFLFVCLFSVT